MRTPFKPGDIVQHFKRTMETEKDLRNNPTLFLYEIIGVAKHSESREPLMVYKTLYTAHNCKTGEIYVRPYKMFCSKVDKSKYPEAKQEYRFEIFRGL